VRDEPGDRLGELAGHWAAAVVSSNPAKAMHYARRAAERALGQLAPDDAARWYRQALELYDQAPGGDRSERCELLIGLGEASARSEPEHRETLLGAAGLAQELGDAERLCRAVLANSRGWMSNFGGVDSERVQALEATAEHCRMALRSGAGARAAGLRAPLRRQPARCRALAAEAMRLPDRPAIPAALAHVLSNAIWPS